MRCYKCCRENSVVTLMISTMLEGCTKEIAGHMKCYGENVQEYLVEKEKMVTMMCKNNE
ncbi:hypothetical protein PILCRDRAFT_760196 [Piloderma croceum F 1598]|uniref:Uncharacterized protein n=1 Tax=Piloderma croceum (strain F 1598) TaxID=765440 RepID=A0A0C3ESP1_PILCF|nr:hypothetical protein PILCRDRAFT_760196 [Piloderma croceum F 1598]